MASNSPRTEMHRANNSRSWHVGPRRNHNVAPQGRRRNTNRTAGSIRRYMVNVLDVTQVSDIMDYATKRPFTAENWWPWIQRYHLDHLGEVPLDSVVAKRVEQIMDYGGGPRPNKNIEDNLRGLSAETTRTPSHYYNMTSQVKRTRRCCESRPARQKVRARGHLTWPHELPSHDPHKEGSVCCRADAQWGTQKRTE